MQQPKSVVITHCNILTGDTTWQLTWSETTQKLKEIQEDDVAPTQENDRPRFYNSPPPGTFNLLLIDCPLYNENRTHNLGDGDLINTT